MEGAESFLCHEGQELHQQRTAHLIKIETSYWIQCLCGQYVHADMWSGEQAKGERGIVILANSGSYRSWAHSRVRKVKAGRGSLLWCIAGQSFAVHCPIKGWIAWGSGVRTQWLYIAWRWACAYRLVDGRLCVLHYSQATWLKPLPCCKNRPEWGIWCHITELTYVLFYIVCPAWRDQSRHAPCYCWYWFSICQRPLSVIVNWLLIKSLIKEGFPFHNAS